MSPDQEIRRYAVIGNPVEHSQSPFIHACFARQTGLAIEYGRVLSPLDGFEATVRAFAATGASGCNVTVPFKFEVPRLAARRSPRVELAQAANTLRFDADGWSAENTDGLGLRRDLEVNAKASLQGSNLLLIGAGGASAGVLGPLIEAHPAQIRIVNRTLSRAQELVARHAALARQCNVCLSASDLEPHHLGTDVFDVVINASSSSLQGAESPIEARRLAPGALVVDLMYGAAADRFLAWAQAHGAVGRDGLGMLVEQAAEAYAFWNGVRPETAEVLERLRERLAFRAA